MGASVLQLMGGDRERQGWVIKATAAHPPGLPKPKHARSLVLSLRDGTLAGPALCGGLGARPWRAQPVVALKLVALALKALQQGPPAMRRPALAALAATGATTGAMTGATAAAKATAEATARATAPATTSKKKTAPATLAADDTPAARAPASQAQATLPAPRGDLRPATLLDAVATHWQAQWAAQLQARSRTGPGLGPEAVASPSPSVPGVSPAHRSEAPTARTGPTEAAGNLDTAFAAEGAAVPRELLSFPLAGLAGLARRARLW